MRKRLSYLGFFVCFIFLFLFNSCATMNMNNQKPFTQMTFAEKATYFQEWYNKQYDDTMMLGKSTNLSEAQLKVYRTKWDILRKVYPLIKTYKKLVDDHGVPSLENEQEILNFINQLVSMT